MQMDIISRLVMCAIFKAALCTEASVETLKSFVENVEKTTTRDVKWKMHKYGRACFYFVSSAAEKKHLTAIRKDIQKRTGARMFVQVIGSSAEIRKKANERLKILINQSLSKKKTVIVYGVTGGKEGVNNVVNGIMEERPEYKKFVVGNLVGKSFNWLKRNVLPGYMTYLFDESGQVLSTKFGDDNELADMLSDSFLVVGGGKQTFDQLDGALRTGKRAHIVTLKGRSNVHLTNRLSAGDIVVKAKKHLKRSAVPHSDSRVDPNTCDEFRNYVLGLLSTYQSKLDEDSMGRIANYLVTWMREGYLKTLVTYDEVQ